MRSTEQKISRRNWNIPAGSIIFFACFYLYVWLFIEPRLIYHSFGSFIAYPAFSLDLGFLKSSMSQPGGVVEYAGGFLSQLYYFSWLGALIVTAAAWLMYLAAKILVRLSAGGTLKIICYIPALMLMMIHNRYDSQLTSFLSLLAALWFSVVYEKMTTRSSAAPPIGVLRSAAVFLVILVLLYYIAFSASFVFAFLVTIYELLTGRRRVLKILFPATAIGVYLVARYIFAIQTKAVHLQLSLARLSFDPWVKNIVICIYFLFPLALFAAGLWSARGWLTPQAKNNLSATKSEIHAKHKSSKTRNIRRFFQNNKCKWTTETVLPIFILAISIFVSFDGTKRNLVQVDYFARQEMWPKVLQTARLIRPESYDIYCIHDIDRALYYTGRLGDEMFRYPQSLSALMLTVKAKMLPDRMYLKVSQFLLELGHVADAERSAFEYMELVGNSPVILEQLATIKLVKGQVEAAKVFLRALSKDLIFGHRGREMLVRLEKDPGLAGDKRIQYIRSVASGTENVSEAFGEEFFSQLLDKNKNNKMAFEYMMAFYLITGQIEKVAANIGRLNDLGYEKLPKYYEEAIVIYMVKSKKQDLPVAGWQPRPETIERAKTVGGTYNLYRGNEQHIRKALGPDFADSYFLYYLFDAPRAIK